MVTKKKTALMTLMTMEKNALNEMHFKQQYSSKVWKIIRGINGKWLLVGKSKRGSIPSMYMYSSIDYGKGLIKLE